METGSLDRARRRLEWYATRLNDSISRRFPLRPFSLPKSDRIISFTFDDVPDTAESAGAAILDKHGLHGTFYISGSLVGTKEDNRNLITEDGCRRLVEQGHELGCHTYDHLKVPYTGAQRIVSDLDRNTGYLDTLETDRVAQRNFAYPYCASSVATRRLFADRFATCRGGGNRVNRGMIDLAFLQAVEIRQPDELAAGQTRWIEDLQANPGWLVFYTHDVSNTPTEFGCKPETFEHLVSRAVESGAMVLSIREALAHLGAQRGAA
ncbi:peptidoglycan/xylan/chitin deacetylase (PgdA/CDA1 family) [Ochrobactrum daejeonense]|uniref:Chitooligosaccharide deacetylase n=1 Tax=Brucella daejeonensis TaxID=659015 RepID=A0A7W9AXC9_9HYPH|nr:polysaccharide deacetylase family protein [Brucella daejeonensis]MBB5702355.1 peptidoglycan/xylan/chitin deacetylase (PgdA/CDA1 family) [Brucella daejeonensis]